MSAWAIGSVPWDPSPWCFITISLDLNRSDKYDTGTRSVCKNNITGKSIDYNFLMWRMTAEWSWTKKVLLNQPKLEALLGLGGLCMSLVLAIHVQYTSLLAFHLIFIWSTAISIVFFTVLVLTKLCFVCQHFIFPYLASRGFFAAWFLAFTH